MIKARNSDWAATVNSDASGDFIFNAVPLGEYVVTVAGVGFDPYVGFYHAVDYGRCEPRSTWARSFGRSW